MLNSGSKKEIKIHKPKTNFDILTHFLNREDSDYNLRNINLLLKIQKETLR